MSELCPNVFTMIRYSGATVEILAEALGQELRAPVADPFAEDLILTRSGALQRWLTQQLSLTLGSTGSGDGICARIRFCTVEQFTDSLRADGPDWSADALFPQVLSAVEDLVDTDPFARVRTHLGDPNTRPRRRSGFARQTANRFAHYIRWNADMLSAWQRGEFVLADGSPVPRDEVWQALTWNQMCEMMGSTPEQDLAQVCTIASSQASRFSRIGVFCPDLLTAAHERILAALDCGRGSGQPVMVFGLQHRAADNEDLRRLSARLSFRSWQCDEALSRLDPHGVGLTGPSVPLNLLGRVQMGLRGDAPGSDADFGSDRDFGNDRDAAIAFGARGGSFAPRPGQAGTAVPCRDGFDDSIQIHAAHANQQVEVLADLLVDLLRSDPGLEPKDILVLVHNMDDYAASLDAFFRTDDSLQAGARHRIRASVCSDQPPAHDPAELLVFLMDLVNGRATAEDLLRICASPFVAGNFGFTSGDLDRLSTLVPASGIRWGLNAAQRGSEGMESFPQNTWMAGLGRMVLGVGLSEEDLTYRGTVLPLDAVDSDTVRVVEALGQIIAAVRRCCETWTTPAAPAGWADRFITALDDLTGSAWRTTPTWKAIAGVRLHACPDLSLAEIEPIFAQIWKEQAWHSAFLNGDLAVTPLGSMSLVPARVIILLGLDADSFPHPTSADGEDLADIWQRHASPVQDGPAGPAASGQCEDGKPHDRGTGTEDGELAGGHIRAGNQDIDSPRIRDRQIFHDALMSAREKFIAIYKGFDSLTSTPAPMPTPLADLLELAGLCSQPDQNPTSTGSLTPFSGLRAQESLVRVHSSERSAPSRGPGKGGPVGSQAGTMESTRSIKQTTAQTISTPSHGAEPTAAASCAIQITHHHRSMLTVEVNQPGQIDIDDMCDLFINPASYWLRRNAGIQPSVLKQSDPTPCSMTVTMSALDSWQVTSRMIRLLLAEKPADAIIQAELRRGILPPSQAGVQAASECMVQARSVVARAQPLLSVPLSWRSILVDSGQDMDLTGQIGVHGSSIVEVLAGRVQPRHEISAWIKLLGLQTAYPEQIWTANLIGNKASITLTSPNPDDATRFLARLSSVYLAGLASPLPLPAAPAAHLARFTTRGLRPTWPEISRRLSNEWAHDPAWQLIWPTQEDMRGQKQLPSDSSMDFPSRFEALSHEVYEPLIRAGGVS